MTNPEHSGQGRHELAVSDLAVGDEIEWYLVATNEGWEWVHGTVIGLEPFRVRFWDGVEKTLREGAKTPNIRRYVKPPASRISDELFVSDDGGNGPYWLTAEGRTASEAAAVAERFCGPFEDGYTVAPVTGFVEPTGEGWWVRLDDDGPVDLWEIDA